MKWEVEQENSSPSSEGGPGIVDGDIDVQGDHGNSQAGGGKCIRGTHFDST